MIRNAYTNMQCNLYSDVQLNIEKSAEVVVDVEFSTSKD